MKWMTDERTDAIIKWMFFQLISIHKIDLGYDVCVCECVEEKWNKPDGMNGIDNPNSHEYFLFHSKSFQHFPDLIKCMNDPFIHLIFPFISDLEIT